MTRAVTNISNSWARRGSSAEEADQWQVAKERNLADFLRLQILKQATERPSRRSHNRRRDHLLVSPGQLDLRHRAVIIVIVIVTVHVAVAFHWMKLTTSA